MTVTTWVDPIFVAQDATSYKTALDGAAKVAKRIVDAFAPHESSTPNMTVTLDAGAVLVGISLTEQAAQVSGTIAAPSGSNKRIDRAVIDAATGALSIVTGTPTAGTPSAPAIPSGKLPCAQIGTVASPLLSSTTAIANSMIVDERVFLGPGAAMPLSGGTFTGNIAAPTITATINVAAPEIGNVGGTLLVDGSVVQIQGGELRPRDNVTQSFGDATHIWASAFTSALDAGSGPVSLVQGQLKFPATQNPSSDPNTLDDYEEGTWTAGIAFNGASVGMTFSNRSGVYIKVGTLLWCGYVMTLSSKGSSGGLATITGFPFTVVFNFTAPVAFFSMTTALVNLILSGGGSTTTAQFNHLTAAAVSYGQPAATDFSNTSQFAGSFTGNTTN
jgi:hypothetical protein